MHGAELTDERAVTCARIARGFHALMTSALASLRLHYAARIAALMLVRRGDPSAALAALELERDAALFRLREAIRQEKEAAIRQTRANRRRRPYHAAISRRFRAALAAGRSPSGRPYPSP